MLDFEGSRAAIRRDLGGIVASLEGLSAERWTSPTRLEGWTVRDLADHVASVAVAQAKAFENMLAGSTETPAVGTPSERGPEELVETLRSGCDRLIGALEKITVSHQGEIVPLPFGTMPCALAIYVPLIEYGFHRNDLEWALGNEGPVSEDIATTTLATLPGFLPSLQTEPSDEPLAYTLAAPSATITIVCREGVWAMGEPGGVRECRISGDDSAVALFALGRIPAGHPSLTIDGATEAASMFKTHFPGP